MYVCIGMLALAIAFHLGARYGQAAYLHHTETGIIAMLGGKRFLLDNGEIWVWRGTAQGWELDPDTSLLSSAPVSLSQIKFMRGPDHFITFSDDLWHYDYLGWHNYGPPGGGVATVSTTWGRIKAEFGE